MNKQELLEHIVAELLEYEEGLRFCKTDKAKARHTAYRAEGIIAMLLGFELLTLQENKSGAV